MKNLHCIYLPYGLGMTYFTPEILKAFGIKVPEEVHIHPRYWSPEITNKVLELIENFEGYYKFPERNIRLALEEREAYRPKYVEKEVIEDSSHRVLWKDGLEVSSHWECWEGFVISGGKRCVINIPVAIVRHLALEKKEKIFIAIKRKK